MLPSGPNARAVEAVWRPIPGTSQAIALDTRADVTLYTGARGPGKTDTQLMRFRSRVGIGYGTFWRGVIFDREYKNLDDLVSKSKRWFYAFEDGARFLESKADYRWIWPTGEELLIRAAWDENDYWNYHGQEYPFLGYNELCKYPTLKFYDMMMSCNRSSFTQEKDAAKDRDGKPVELKAIPLEVFATTNPFGPGHAAVKTRFIDPVPYGTMLKTPIDVFDPKTKETVTVVKTQVALFGSWRENIYLDPKYIAQLMSDEDPNRRAAWLKGSWDIASGGALSDVWIKSTHEIAPFRVPAGWRIDRAFDWGSSHPFSVGFWAETNGEEAILADGSTFCPPPGSLIQIDEIYGSENIGSNTGMRWAATDIALEIIDRQRRLLEDGWIPELPWAGPADNQIRENRESDQDTIEKKMAKFGVTWEKSDKSNGSRKIGLQLARDRLNAAKKLNYEEPWLMFMSRCRASIALLPNLPRDEVKIDDVDTKSEDHVWDMTRYRVLKGSNRLARKLPFQFPT